ncbi:MAG TPA: hypothetical protein VFM04_03280 [Candidatus Methylomirabilis sp.]|nr:hypothetical protein [Candidatus Methylomirabilis sp.]
MKKVLGMVVLAVALLVPAQGIMAADPMKMMEDTDKKLENLKKMMQEKKMKMTPEQEKEMTKRFQDFNEYLDGLMKRAG